MTMQTETWKKPAAPFAQAASTIFGIVALRMKQFVQGFKNRGDAALLARLDDRMLADIGLTRGDLRDAYSEPLWRDPTAILVDRVSERRINRRRSSFGVPHLASEAPSVVPTVGDCATTASSPATR